MRNMVKKLGKPHPHREKGPLNPWATLPGGWFKAQNQKPSLSAENQGKLTDRVIELEDPNILGQWDVILK